MTFENSQPLSALSRFLTSRTRNLILARGDPPSHKCITPSSARPSLTTLSCCNGRPANRSNFNHLSLEVRRWVGATAVNDSCTEGEQTAVLQHFKRVSKTWNPSLLLKAAIQSGWQCPIQRWHAPLNMILQNAAVGLGIPFFVLLRPIIAVASNATSSSTGYRSGLPSRSVSKQQSANAKHHFAWFKGESECGQCHHSSVRHLTQKCSICEDAYFLCSIDGCSCREGRCVGH